MKTGWKWVIGIVSGLVVLAILACGFFMMRSHYVNARLGFQQERGLNQNNPWGDEPGQFKRQFGPGMMGQQGFRHPGMMGRNGYQRPGMMGYGFMPWGGVLGLFFFGLVKLGFLALVVLGIIWLVRSLKARKSASTAASVSVAVQSPSASKAACVRCQQPLEPEWKVCPNCGKKI